MFENKEVRARMPSDHGSISDDNEAGHPEDNLDQFYSNIERAVMQNRQSKMSKHMKEEEKDGIYIPHIRFGNYSPK